MGAEQEEKVKRTGESHYCVKHLTGSDVSFCLMLHMAAGLWLAGDVKAEAGSSGKVV